jgi:NADPH2:quinone reductase
MASSMRAVVLSAPGPVKNLQIRHLPLPEPEPGWVRIKVKAFGLNRSELHTRLGLAEGVTFPRVLGIECVGVVDAIPDGDLPPGQQVAAMMGGMGRTFDGGSRGDHHRALRIRPMPWRISRPQADRRWDEQPASGHDGG